MTVATIKRLNVSRSWSELQERPYRRRSPSAVTSVRQRCLEMKQSVHGTHCTHCGQPLAERSSTAPARPSTDTAFCCSGCAAAHALINGLGLDDYYRRRTLDPTLPPPIPDADAPCPDMAAQVIAGTDGVDRLHLMVDGLQCAACVWLIEAVLARQPGVVEVRLNMTTRRLCLGWTRGASDPATLVAVVASLGYRLMPFDPQRLDQADRLRESRLLRALAVSGFAAGNVMLLSVSVWAGHAEGMGPATRGLMHWLSALIALPAVAYASRPFVDSAVTALRAGRLNMDVPIAVAVLLAAGMSLVETIRGADHVYFDSALTLLFFLLIGRLLDQRARGRARSAAEHLLVLKATAVTVLEPDGRSTVLPPEKVAAGMTVLVAMGERIGVDGTVIDGRSAVDTTLITGESVPAQAGPGDRVFAGTVNLGAPLRLRVDAVGTGTLLAEIVQLMETAEQGRARSVALAERVSRLYAPVVHGAALATFLVWWLSGAASWQDALMIAVAVLIITCPCALGLAVPVVQVVASSRLFRRGVLLKSATALERLSAVDTVVFDKTGTLTEGRLRPDLSALDAADRHLAAALAGASRHPLARALAQAVPGVAIAPHVREVPGAGLVSQTPAGEARLGSYRFVVPEALDDPEPEGGAGPELWLRRPGRPPLRVGFADSLRGDAVTTINLLKKKGYIVHLVSGDRRTAVATVAQQTGIDAWQSARSPADKAAFLADLMRKGHTPMMVGDGLNDAPALAAAAVSLSPATAADISQIAADGLFQGVRLAPVAEVLAVARRADRLVRQNMALAIAYNVITIPLAVAGLVTPLIAALAMSSSSVLVVANALRLGYSSKGVEDDGVALFDRRGDRLGPARTGGVSVGPSVGPV